MKLIAALSWVAVGLASLYGAGLSIGLHPLEAGVRVVIALLACLGAIALWRGQVWSRLLLTGLWIAGLSWSTVLGTCARGNGASDPPPPTILEAFRSILVQTDARPHCMAVVGPVVMFFVLGTLTWFASRPIATK